MSLRALPLPTIAGGRPFSRRRNGKKATKAAIDRAMTIRGTLPDARMIAARFRSRRG